MNVGRLEELTNDIEKLNDNGGNTRNEWILFLLTQINISLATIADCLSKGGGQEEDGANETEGETE